MKKRLNILFSTTRYWNVWDEFIMRWIENLLNEIWVKYNKIIYNRNQEVNWWFEFLNPLRWNFWDRYSDTIWFQFLNAFIKLGFFDNSFAYKYYNKFKNNIEYVIWAGSPEWAGYRSKILFNLINKENISWLMLWIWEAWYPWNKWKKWIIEGVKKQKLIILRNPEDYENFRKLNKNTFQLSCPALFSALENEEKWKINEIKSIGCTFSFPSSSSSHSVKNEIFEKYISFIKFLKNNYPNLRLYAVFHHIKDLVLFNSDYNYLKDLFIDTYYSGDREDYFNFYKDFDIVISTRVHWNGIASSLLIPNIAFTHDKRWSTVMWFWSYTYDNDNNTLDHFKRIINNPSHFQEQLKNLKKSQKSNRLDLLSNVFSNEK